jgi:hypothetical protein
MLRRYLYAFAFLAITFPSYSQEFLRGYLVKSPGDTLHGLLLNAGSAAKATRVVFKREPAEKPTTYLPGEIVSYVLGVEHYVTQRVENTSFFLREVTYGLLSLYVLNQRGASRYFFKKESYFAEVSPAN